MQSNGASLIERADQAMVSGDTVLAASLLELAAQRFRDATILMRLAVVRRALGDIEGAASVALAAVELAPRNFLMALMLGSLRELTGATHGAVRAYRMALQHVPAELPFQPGIQGQLAHARACVDAEDAWHRRLLDWNSADHREALGVEGAKRMRGFRANLLEDLESSPLSAPKFIIPGLAPRSYFEAGEFAGVEDVAGQVGDIRDEFLGLVATADESMRSRMAGLHGAASTDSNGKWSMIPLIRNGERVASFADQCPKTMAALDSLDLPQLGLISPSVYFSTLEPGTHIPAHTGITNARAIFHLPLVVPDGCRFRVGEETRHWRYGEPLIFDDMTMHEAWNDGSGLRAVLIIDLWRPELSAAERKVIETLMRFDFPQA